MPGEDGREGHQGESLSTLSFARCPFALTQWMTRIALQGAAEKAGGCEGLGSLF